MSQVFGLPVGYSFEMEDGAFTLSAALSCPLGEARCLAVTAASWVRDAVGGDAYILWPNHVVLGEARVCAITCRATAAGELVFSFAPTEAMPLPADELAARVADAAERALAGFPGNQPALMQAYCDHCRTVMKFVDVTYRGMPLYGFAFAVDRHGGLMVMTQESHTVVTVYGGEAVIVKKEDAPANAPEVPIMPGR